MNSMTLTIDIDPDEAPYEVEVYFRCFEDGIEIMNVRKERVMLGYDPDLDREIMRQLNDVIDRTDWII